MPASAPSISREPGGRRPLKVFVSYSKQDDRFRERLEVHLSHLCRTGKIEIWYDGRLTGGEEWLPTIEKKLLESDLILFLMSPDFFATDFIEEKEILLALKRHREGDARVIPILLKNVHRTGHQLDSLQGLQKEFRPVVGDSLRKRMPITILRRSWIRRSRSIGDSAP